MTLHLEGDELRLAERAIEALETIAEKLTVEPEAPKSMPVPERFSLTENRRFVDGYCEAATIDGGKVTRRCLRGKDHDGECDMRDVCRGTPGMASWKRCEKAKGHVNPCTYDPSTNDGHVSPANDDDGLPDRAEATAHVLDCFESFLAGMRNSPDWTPKERGAVRKAIEAARETLEGKCTCDTPGGVHPPPCPKGDALERAAEREALSVGREVVRGRRPVSALVEAFRRLVPRDEHAGRAEHALLTGACPVCGGQRATESLEGCTANACLVRPGQPEPDRIRLCQHPHGLVICGKKEPCEDHTPGVLREIATILEITTGTRP